ncbi:AaceriAAL101Wp [[Ashbya] aceris (nom. inval.)]|nr:AaceriAAL101Wp [[Ashbya] aceris (nom. inval.)]
MLRYGRGYATARRASQGTQIHNLRSVDRTQPKIAEFRANLKRILAFNKIPTVGSPDHALLVASCREAGIIEELPILQKIPILRSKLGANQFSNAAVRRIINAMDHAQKNASTKAPSSESESNNIFGRDNITSGSAKGHDHYKGHSVDRERDLKIIEDLLRPAASPAAPVRKYDWNIQGKKQRPVVKYGELLPFGNDYRKTQRYRFKYMRLLGGNKESKPSSLETLTYDITRHYAQIITHETSSLYSIDKKDLFTLINGSSFSPEEMLEVIDRHIAQGWELVGEVRGEPTKLVFQRKQQTHKPSMPFARVIYTTGALLVGGLLVSYCYI